MKNTHILLLILAAAVAAGLWLLRPHTLDVEPVVDVPGSCAQDSTCSTVVAPDEPQPPAVSVPGPAPRAAAPPAAVAPPPAPSPASPAEGKRLREEADRLIAEGRVLEGIEAMRKAAEADPSARNHGDLGALLARLTAFDEAARNLQRAAELDPANADRWIALANVYYRKAEPGEAWKAERRALEAEPGLVLGRDAQGLRIRGGDSAADKK